MSVNVIQQRLSSYNCLTEIEEQQAIREITQEVILAALGRHDFFKQAIFQGGTCLRIFYGLNRYSEDLDFILRQPNLEFSLQDHLGHVANELAAFGYNIEITDKNDAETIVKKTFLKDSSLGKVIQLSHVNQSGPLAKIRIKLEVDTNPPGGTGLELKYLDFPFVSGVVVQDQSSLFAGKIHALLCRKYTKGRDWYDFIWYTSQGVGVNFEFLSAAINQTGPWQGQEITTDRMWLIENIRSKITTLNWEQAAEDVRRFIRVNEQPSIDLWGQGLFLSQLEKLKQTL